ncbi:MAG: ABC transporter permease, partial [Methylococcales bacterium]
MTNTPINPDLLPVLEVFKQDDGQVCVKLSGCWNLRSLSMNVDIQRKLKNIGANTIQQWDMRCVDMLDSGAALILWQAWGEKMPSALQIKPEHQGLLARWQAQSVGTIEVTPFRFRSLLENCGQTAVNFWIQVLSFLSLLGQLVLDSIYLLAHPQDIPWAEISITIYDAGVRALGIT